MVSTTDRGDAWPELHRARRTVAVVDVVESVRLMARDEDGFIAAWRRFVNDVRAEVLPGQGGRLVKSLGDGMLLEFAKVTSAVSAVLDMQRRIERGNLGRAAEGALSLRAGVHVCDVVVDELDVYGTGVNLAARLASLAGPGQTVVSAEVRDELVPGLDPSCIDLGDCFVKHLRESVRAYRLASPEGAAGASAAPPPQDGLEPALLVLPLQCTADDDSQRVAGDVLHDALVATLAARPELRVVSRLSAATLVQRPELSREFLRSLGADYALSGSCRILGGRVVAGFELVELRAGQIVWSGQERTDLRELLEPHCELVERVCGGVAARLVQLDACRSATLPLPTLESHALHLGAVSLMHRSSGAHFERVRDILEHLIERHGRIAAPRAWLAKWYVLRMTRGLAGDARQEAQRALDHTRRAVDADPHCALALAMEGFVHCHLLRDLGTAAQRLDAAIGAGPNEPLAWLFRGVVHAFADEGDAGLQCAERALSLSPIDPLRYYFDSLAAAAAAAAGRHERAIELARRSLQANCMHTSTYRTLAIAQVCSGRAAEANETVQRLLALEPGFSIERFLARVPAGSSAIGLRFAQALEEAGVPRGDAAH